MLAPRTPRASGLTLTELLVVIAIIILLSAATLPTAYVTFAERAVSEGANLVQGNLSMTRDRATGTGQPQGVRFLPDPDLTDLDRGIVASSRMVTLTTPPNYSEGMVIPIVEIYVAPFPGIPPGVEIRRLAVYGAKTDNRGLPTSPTAWHFNVRQGETIRIDGAGTPFTIAGPMTVGPATGNPDRFINRTVNGQLGGAAVQANPINAEFEILHLVNGRDDSGDGYIDPHFDGIDNNGDGVVDPGYNGVDDNGNGLIDDPAEFLRSPPGFPGLIEYEADEPISRAFRFARVNNALINGVPGVIALTDVGNPGATPIPITDHLLVRRYPYVISRRPSPAPDAREYTLPGGAVVDFTTAALGPASERSRVPIDPVTGIVDLMIYPDGRVIPSTPYGLRQAMAPEYPFYFLWIAAREDVHPPQRPAFPRLPMPREAGAPGPPFLQGYRRLVAVSPNSGHASVSEITAFSPANVDAPYAEALFHQQTGR